MCIPVAVCNAVNLLGDTSLAKEYWNDFIKTSLLYEVSGALPRRIRDFQDARKRQDERRVRLTRIEGTSHTLSVALAFKSGVVVATLEGTPHVMHSLCFAASDKIIVDCMEESPLRLCTSSLKSCVGAGSVFLTVSELYRVEVFPPPEKKRGPAQVTACNAGHATRRHPSTIAAVKPLVVTVIEPPLIITHTKVGMSKCILRGNSIRRRTRPVSRASAPVLYYSD